MAGWEVSLCNLIATAPKLKNLALCLDRNGTRQSTAVMRSLALSCRVEELECFHITNCFIHADDLATFLRAHGTLRRLILADIHLFSGHWTSIWACSKELAGLKSLRLASLTGMDSPLVHRRRKNGRSQLTLDVEKDGRSMSELLDDLIAARNAEMEPLIANPSTP
jgi:hypothetical protein